MNNIISYLPLDNTLDDKLGFGKKAQEIAGFINNSSSRSSFAISINGSWGSGKSTMLNFIDNGLNKRKCRVIRFNPWMVSDREGLIENLFEEIYYEIDGEVYTKAKTKFKEYAQKIVPSVAKISAYLGSVSHGAPPQTASIFANGAGEVVKAVGDTLSNKPLSKRKRELQEELEIMFSENNEKIVVMIDEIDRLFPDEIITVFQMIKAVLDLPGIFFLIAMDEKVVNEALTSKGIGSPEYYLQKIFQRNYHIKTKYQIRTLTDHFLVKNIDLNLECFSALKDALNAFIYSKKENWVLNFDESIIEDYIESYISSSIKDSQEESFKIALKNKITDQNRHTVINSYWNIFRKISDELNIQNPRNFIKFVYYVLEYWEDYYQFIFDNNKKTNYNIQAAFLMLLSNFIYPDYTEKIYIDNRYDLGNEINNKIPEFIKVIREHLDLTLPIFEKSYTPNKGGSSFTQTQRVTIYNIIDNAEVYFNNFPDDN